MHHIAWFTFVRSLALGICVKCHLRRNLCFSLGTPILSKTTCLTKPPKLSRTSLLYLCTSVPPYRRTVVPSYTIDKMETARQLRRFAQDTAAKRCTMLLSYRCPRASSCIKTTLRSAFLRVPENHINFKEAPLRLSSSTSAVHSSGMGPGPIQP
jgi:hypothetical protein